MKNRFIMLFLCTLGLSLNSFAVKNSLFNLTKEAFDLAIRPSNINLKQFWQTVRETENGYDAVEHHLNQYPPIIKDYHVLIGRNIAFYMIGKLGLLEKKILCEDKVIPEDDYLAEYQSRLDSTSVEDRTQWFEAATKEALDAIINCLECIATSDPLGGIAAIDFRIAEKIGPTFAIEVRELARIAAIKLQGQ